MSGRARRLAAVFTVALVSLAIAAFATPEASSSPCQVLWVWDPAINQCSPPPPPPPATVGRPVPAPAWYTPPPPWAPPWAPASVPPPPPTPLWAPQDKTPVWDPGHMQWGIWIGTAWVPL